MRKLIVTKKTGYNVKDVYIPVIIRDNRGIIFYTTEALLPKVESFNLPEGIYFVDSGMFSEAKRPRNYDLPVLPLRQRYFYPSPKNFNVRFASNPNKCTVNWGKKLITFDTSFQEKPLPQVDFIMFHEYGHRFYKTEKYCDLYATRSMLNLGYNPSQIGGAQIESLSDRQEERKEFIIDKL